MSRRIKPIALLIFTMLMVGPYTIAQVENRPDNGNDNVDATECLSGRFYAQIDQSDQFNPGMNARRLRQPNGMRGSGPGWAPDSPRDRKHLEQFRLLKLLELLDMDDDQEVEFIVSFRSHRKVLRKITHERTTAIKELSRKAKRDKIKQDDIAKTMELLDKNDFERNKEHKQFLSKVSAYLSPAQIGKLILFQEKFELELLEAVRGFRQRGKHAPDWNHNDSVSRRNGH